MRLRPLHQTGTFLRVLLVAVALSFVSAAKGAEPRIVQPNTIDPRHTWAHDDDLAKMPVIVVGRWNKAEPESHHEPQGDRYKTFEWRAELVIERVIVGNAKVGRQKILSCRRLYCQDPGGPVGTGVTVEPFDVDDLTRSNLWFLSYKRSWDRKDPNFYLSLDTVRGVQLASLEPYYLALRGTNPRATVPQLLNSEDIEVLERTLRFICGGVLPWPYEPTGFERIFRPQERQFLLYEQAGAVDKLLTRNDKKVRRLAASVYAELVGKESIARMTQLLADPDSHVRAIAIGVLARYNRLPSDEVAVKAATGIDDCQMAHDFIKALRRSNNEKAVPILISFLQNDGDDEPNALWAQWALKELTGYTFPLEVEASREAWGKAKDLPNAQQRQEYLAEHLPYDPTPLKATLVHEKGDVTVVLTNTSKKTVAVLQKPSGIDLRREKNQATATYPPDNEREEAFLTLAPGQSARFPLEVDKEFFQDDFESVTVTLHYYRNGNKLGVNAWMGSVDARWREKRLP